MRDGFDSSAPAKIHKNSFGIEIRFYGLFGYYLDEKFLLVRIFRRTSDFQQYENFDGDILHIYDALKNFKKTHKPNDKI